MAEPNTATATASDGTTVTVLVAPAPPSEEHIADMAWLFLAFVAVAVPIYCIRYLTGLFRADPSDT